MIKRLSGGTYDSVTHALSSLVEPVHFKKGPVFYTHIENEMLPALVSEAEIALRAGPFSVMDKTDCAPSGNKHDYYSTAAYWWPNPETEDGLPYVLRDCDRNPATELYSPASSAFDKTSLQRMLESVLALTLAGEGAKRLDMLDRAAFLVRHWFLAETTCMTPHLIYAQVRPGHGNGRGNHHGFIEARDMALLPDCFAVLRAAEALTDHDMECLKRWFKAFLLWSEDDKNALKERRTPNNHGTNYDLITAAFSLFVGDKRRFQAVAARAKKRLVAQISPDGMQAEEVQRPHKFHYCAYNLQSWLMLARILEHGGVDLWQGYGSLFEQAATSLWCLYSAEKESAQDESFVAERLLPIMRAVCSHRAADKIVYALTQFDDKAMPVSFHPYSGIPPFWQGTRL